MMLKCSLIFMAKYVKKGKLIEINSIFCYTFVIHAVIRYIHKFPNTFKGVVNLR